MQLSVANSDYPGETKEIVGVRPSHCLGCPADTRVGPVAGVATGRAYCY